MGQVSNILRRTTDGYTFWCPGCEEPHHVRTTGVEPNWGFNDNVDAPTFTPSIFVRSGHYAPSGFPVADRSCWCTYNAAHPQNPAPFKCFACHSFVTDGRIQFLGDCSHALANQTVDLPPLPPEMRDKPMSALTKEPTP